MELPSHCHECGALLMGGLTEHRADCMIQKMIEYARDGKVQNPVCDFCSTPNPTHSFGCESFTYVISGVPDRGSQDSWLACDICAEMVLSGDWLALAARNIDLTPSGETLVKLAGINEATRIIMELQAQFRKHATGESHKL